MMISERLILTERRSHAFRQYLAMLSPTLVVAVLQKVADRFVFTL